MFRKIGKLALKASILINPGLKERAGRLETGYALPL